MTILRSIAAVTVASVAWVPNLHHFHDPPEGARTAALLLRHQLAQWRDTAERRTNVEWDLMGRTFLVLAIANRQVGGGIDGDNSGLREMDTIIESTLALEREHGMQHFLLPYGRDRPFVVAPARSLFVDGEIALMIGARRLIADDPRWARLHRERAALIVERMQRSPTLSAESYPDEAWTFCHAIALASLAMLDALDGTDHRPLFTAWIATARARLIEPTTGLLVSSYTLDGRWKDGPEGSSIFMVAHCLALIDRAFARDQYQRAAAALSGELFGFGWAREWPATSTGHVDIDSGPTVPLLDAAPGASGMAILGAAAFGDEERLTKLRRSVELAAFPTLEQVDGRPALQYAASNQVGDAILLYALSQGPLWARIDLLRGEERASCDRC